jgi:hypothetical protein
LNGAAAFRADAPRTSETWNGAFLAALAAEAEAEAGFTLPLLEYQWFAGRSAIQDQRRDSHAAVAVDLMPAAPVVVPATSLAPSLGIAVQNATALLDVFITRGIALEVAYCS